ncbi:Flp family type IVb pilin [Ornithinimicrobium cerasi]|uniref:Flp family type IVb pilin n=1 Tax=Ornithinimicrobium cerasi TaxID=2248773 RepID=UPI000BE377A1|nr:Flp family type IVb pilin [Ornithinimicrobium cerasi]
MRRPCEANGRDSERGATAVEYGLLLALIAGVIISVVTLIGPKLLPGFQTIISALP